MIRLKDTNIVNQALKIAEKNKRPERYSMVAVLVSGRKILSIGSNDYVKTHSKQPQIREGHTIPTHAEVKCISRYTVKNRRVESDMTLYVVGITKSQKINFPISTFPCSSCMEFIRENKIKRIVYTTNINGVFSVKEVLF